jgi:hypothetical protein
MAENSETDWILINLKFRGKCVGCGQVITSGRALWSRSAKTIEHQDCFLGKTNQPSSNEEIGSRNQEMSTHKKHRKTIVQRCLICGKEEPVEDEYHSNEYPYLAESRSQSYICRSCLDSEGAFEAYRQAFLQKIKRYMKPAMVPL